MRFVSMFFKVQFDILLCILKFALAARLTQTTKASNSQGQRPLGIDLLACTSVILLVLTSPLSGKDLERPNILLIVADDLGFSDIGCYGGEIETPNLDRLANAGIRLSQFYSTGRCCPSRATILTGQYSHAVGLGHMTKDLGLPGYRGRLISGTPTIAQVLAQSGYQAYLSGKWHLGTEDPTEHGFLEFYGTLASAKTFWQEDHFLRLPKDRQPIRYEEGEFYGTDALVDHTLEYLEQARESPGKPWFLYLAFNAPHFPLHAPQEVIAKYADRYTDGWDILRKQRLERMKDLGVVPDQTQLSPRSNYYDWGQRQASPIPAWDALPPSRKADLARRMAIYAAMVDRMDANIGRVIHNLEQHDELQNTLIVFTSDNGGCAEWDPFGFDIKSGPKNILHRGKQIDQMGGPDTFHSVGAGWANLANTPWRLYKHFNHEGGIAVPCVIHWPDGMNRKVGTIDHTPTHLIDLAPTFIASAGNHTPKDTIDPPGQSMLPLLEGKPINQRALFFEHEGNRGVRSGNWKLVSLRNQPWELYDIRSDRSEQTDLSTLKPAIVVRLSKAWDNWAEKNKVLPSPKDYQVKYLSHPSKDIRRQATPSGKNSFVE